MIDLADPQNPELADRIVRAAYPNLGNRQTIYAGAGWDNAMYRVGPDLVARFPRKPDSVGLAGVERKLFSLLEELPAMPLELPKPVVAGKPTDLFPYPWSLLTWIDGDSYFDQPAQIPETSINQLARFLTMLHRLTPPGLSANPHRGGPLNERDDATQAYLARLPDDNVDLRDQISAVWSDLLRTPAWSGGQRWLHGDLHPGNLLTRHGHLHAVVDWGDSCVGDPASDLSIAWMLFDHKHRDDFRAALSRFSHPADAPMWERARGWALSLGLAHLTGSDDANHIRLGRRTIAEALNP